MAEPAPSAAGGTAKMSGPLPWPNLPAGGLARVLTLIGRAVARRCPYCGGGKIFANYFTLRELCPTCEVRFEREEGYFLGGYALNLVASEILALSLAVWLLFGTPLRTWSLLQQEALAVALAVAFPLALYPYSRTVWIAVDLLLHPPREDEERTLTARDMRRGRPPGAARR